MDDEPLWDDAAATFDQEPDHGLTDPAVRDAWADLLLRLLPGPPADVTDLGCGTGSLSVLLAESGYSVRGLDRSVRMIERARTKAAGLGQPVVFTLGDAARPPYRPSSADVVLVRHVLWALPDPDGTLAAWVRLLRPSGRLVLVEGRWSTGAGLAAEECQAIVLRHRSEAEIIQLDDSALWGRRITDVRYALVSKS